MIHPIEATILQGIGNILFDSGREILNVCISESGIFKFADVETELFNHRSEASDSQLHVRAFEVDSIVALIADKKVGN